MSFLRTSADAFDDGAQAESTRLAAVIRILVHDTNSSHSLLGQLGVKDRLRYVDTALDPIPGNEASTNGLVMMHLGGGGPVFAAPLDKLSPRRQSKPAKSFLDWWTTTVILDASGSSFSRMDLVLALANKEGGAHVDPELEASYAALSRSGSLGWIVSDDTGARPLTESPVPASVRQIAYELELTVLAR